MLLDHLRQDALEQGQGVGDVGVEAVGEALDLPQVLVLLVLEDELRGKRCQEGFPGGTPPILWDEKWDQDPLTSTCPKVCTRGTTSSLWSSASCWIRSMSSSLGGQGQAQQGMPEQRAEREGIPSSSSGTCPSGPSCPTPVWTLLWGHKY